MSTLNLNRRALALPPQGGRAPRPFEPSNTRRTYERAPAAEISPELALRRAVCACLLWEREAYESGEQIAARIKRLVAEVPVGVACDLAVEARTHLHLRHVPLLVLAAVAAPGRKPGRVLAEALAETIQRADELTEFVAVYAATWGVAPNAVKKHLSAQAKKGLARAFARFDEFALGRYFSASGEAKAAVRGRDVMFLAHPRPDGPERAELYRRLAEREPLVAGGVDTWEVALAKGADKRETFERLLAEEKLGYLALLRNLRGMTEAGVPQKLITAALRARRGARRVLPFRYVAAARAAPQFAEVLDVALRAAVADLAPLPGRTAVLVDVSGSMNVPLSARSDLTRMDAAAALAALLPGDRSVFTFSGHVVPVSEADGLNGIAQIIGSQPHGGTLLGQAVERINAMGDRFDRLVVVTDEQSHDYVSEPLAAHAYMINVASARNGVGYGERWVHLDGFSEQVIRWIAEFERI